MQVGSKDTLNSIALQFNITPNKLVQLNRLFSRSVLPGQVSPRLHLLTLLSSLFYSDFYSSVLPKGVLLFIMFQLGFSSVHPSQKLFVPDMGQSETGKVFSDSVNMAPSEKESQVEDLLPRAHTESTLLKFYMLFLY